MAMMSAWLTPQAAGFVPEKRIRFDLQNQGFKEARSSAMGKTSDLGRALQ